MFFDGSGVTDTVSQFFAGLVANTTVVVADGTISGTTLTAADIALAPGTSGGQILHTAAIQGIASNASPAAGTFDVGLVNWEGGMLQKGGVIHVTTSSTTQFTNAGAPQTQAGFFASLTKTTQVQVRGTFDASTMTVTATQVSTGGDKQFHF
jgi:hypothetical protein